MLAHVPQSDGRKFSSEGRAFLRELLKFLAVASSEIFEAGRRAMHAFPKDLDESRRVGLVVCNQRGHQRARRASVETGLKPTSFRGFRVNCRARLIQVLRNLYRAHASH